MELPELKVLPEGEPLFLLGTDVLVDTRQEWRSCYLGIHPETRQGTMVVVNNEGAQEDIALVRWPTALKAGGQREQLAAATPPAKEDIKWPPKRVSFAPDTKG